MAAIGQIGGSIRRATPHTAVSQSGGPRLHLVRESKIHSAKAHTETSKVMSKEEDSAAEVKGATTTVLPK